MNRQYQIFGASSFEDAMRLLRSADESLVPHAFGQLFEVYENYLNSLQIGPVTATMRDRNKLFEEHLESSRLVNDFVDTVIRSALGNALASFQPRVFLESEFQQSGEKNTSAHDAYASDFARVAAGRRAKEPIARLLNLLYVVRCNAFHGQKALPRQFADMQSRNRSVFAVSTPIVRAIASWLFESLWTDGLFVYGTCKPGAPNYGVIESYVKGAEPASVAGTLLDLGQYPGLSLTGSGAITGYVLKASEPRKLLAITDELEGQEYLRQLVWTSGEKELPRLVWVYVYGGCTEGVARIQSGEWVPRSAG